MIGGKKDFICFSKYYSEILEAMLEVIDKAHRKLVQIRSTDKAHRKLAWIRSIDKGHRKLVWIRSIDKGLMTSRWARNNWLFNKKVFKKNDLSQESIYFNISKSTPCNKKVGFWQQICDMHYLCLLLYLLNMVLTYSKDLTTFTFNLFFIQNSSFFIF